MQTAFDYPEIARECMKEAEATKDASRKKVQDIARFYTQMGLPIGDFSLSTETENV
jgi:hypothetical protein